MHGGASSIYKLDSRQRLPLKPLPPSSGADPDWVQTAAAYLRGYNWVHFAPRLYVGLYCYLEFKLRYLKNLKLFLIRVKEKKGDGFLLFLKAFSWETDKRWVILL